MVKIISGERDPKNESFLKCNPQLADIIRLCLSLSPQDRPNSKQVLEMFTKEQIK